MTAVNALDIALSYDPTRLQSFSVKQLKLRDGMIVDKALHTLEIQIK